MLRIVAFTAAAVFVPALTGDAIARMQPATSPKPLAQKKPHESVLYGFRGAHHGDGRYPTYGVTVGKDGSVFGVTDDGGSRTCGDGSGCGTIFAVKPSGSGYSETILHTFTGGSDGDGPSGQPVEASTGVLYAPVASGGPTGNGYIFAFTPTASGYDESIAYAFPGGAGGAAPFGPLLLGNNGVLYGLGAATTAAPCGTAFALTQHGSTYVESAIYAFAGGSNDACLPNAGLLAGKGGVLFGSSDVGGTGDGTLYELTPTGSTFSSRVVYNFQKSVDGGAPNGQLVADASGTFYGTTMGGSIGSKPTYGTVYALAPNGSSYQQTTLHTFTYGPGMYPNGQLAIDKRGDVFGTTYDGGTGKRCYVGCGIVFELTRSGTTFLYQLLYEFLGINKSDGSNPRSGITYDGASALYGVTYFGGPGGCGRKGCGAVYKVTLPASR